MKKATSFRHALLCMYLLTGFIPLLHAQSTRSDVTGIVRSEITGRPLEGVSVTVVNAKSNFTASSTTDSAGVFTFNQLPAGTGYSFTFSYVGHETQTMNGYNLKPGADFSFVVQLKEADVKMDEVVVVGYGTMKKRDLTGAVSQVQTAKLEKENPRSVQDLLRSNAPGIVVAPTNTAKGGGQIRIRGQRSLAGNNDPLIVLDGVIFFGELSEINPLDIEKIDLLKDASAAAVYGAKSANGVILITTKKGKTEKPEVRFTANRAWAHKGANRYVYDANSYLQYRSDLFNANTAYATPAKFVRPTPENLAKFGITIDEWRAFDNAAGTDDEVWLQRIGLYEKEIANFKRGATYDWYEGSFQVGLQQNYNVSLAGKATDKVNYYLGLGYQENEGIIPGDFYRAYRANFKIDAKVNKWYSTGFNVNFQDRTDLGAPGDDDIPGFVTDWGGQIINNSPFAYPWLDDGTLDPQPMGNSLNQGTNTAFHNQYKTLQRGRATINTTLYHTIRLPFNITYTMNFSPRMQWFHNRYHESSQNPFWTDNGKAVRENVKRYEWQIDNIINWDYTFARKHNVKVTLLQNAESHYMWKETMTARDFLPTDALGYHNMGAGNPQKTTISSDDQKHTGDALMARMFYSFDNKYMITASIRRDGYSAFGKKNPRATFPAVAVAWNFGEEKFLESFRPLTSGKLRLSWGQNGNRDIGIYTALANLTTGAGRYPYVKPDGTVNELAQLYVDRMANHNLKWEATSSWNAGLDLSFLGSRINASIDVYHKPTTDMLMRFNLTDITGFDNVTSNLGEVVNDGFELQLNTVNMTKRNFEWNTTFGFFYNKNKIKHLYYTYEDILNDNGEVIGSKELDDLGNRWFIGQDIHVIWDYKKLGIWQESEKDAATRYGQKPGDVKVLDVDDDGQLNDKDKVFQGTEVPRYRLTMRNDFTIYKNFDLSINMYAYLGHKQSTTEYLNNTGASMERTNSHIRGYWTPENPSNEYARLNSTKPQNVTVPWVMDKSFVRLENISLAYTVPSKFASRLLMTSCRLYASVRNLGFYAPNWQYWDPETGRTEGIDRGSQPLPRTYSIGLTASF
jgi:TonB-linked outer membrane protein, SusC/RagA family